MFDQIGSKRLSIDSSTFIGKAPQSCSSPERSDSDAESTQMRLAADQSQYKFKPIQTDDEPSFDNKATLKRLETREKSRPGSIGRLERLTLVSCQLESVLEN